MNPYLSVEFHKASQNCLSFLEIPQKFCLREKLQIHFEYGFSGVKFDDSPGKHRATREILLALSNANPKFVSNCALGKILVEALGINLYSSL